MGGLFADLASMMKAKAGGSSSGQSFVGRIVGGAVRGDAAMSPSAATAPRPPGTMPAWALPVAAVGGVVLLAVLLRSPKRRNPGGGRRRRRRRR